MIRKLWTFETYEDCDYSIDELSCLKNFIGSPPPPYTAEDLLRNEQSKKKPLEKERKLSYCDVGQEIYITIRKKPNEELGLTLLNGDSFEPKWPTILDIRDNSPAAHSVNTLQIGDQIKELCGIPTETLTHSQILALFSKATDQVNMVIRRGVEPSDRSFKWYKHPFSSVSHTFEEIAIVDDKKEYGDFDEHLHAQAMLFQSFKSDDNHLNKKRENQYSKPVFGIRHIRSFSASATCQRNFLTQIPRQRRRTLDHTGKIGTDLFSPFTHNNVCKGGKYIADEIEKLSISEKLLADSRCDSQSSLNSSLSSSSFSNTSSGTSHGRISAQRPQWMSQMLSNTSTEETSGYDSNDLSLNPSFKTKTPVNIIRNSFRKRKTKKESITERDDCLDKSAPATNTLLLTVWIADRRKLGLKLEGGNISPYGDSNLVVQEVKKTGSANKIFQMGDEILEIDGQSMNNFDVNEANRLISRLEGNYVEFKIFRPIK